MGKNISPYNALAYLDKLCELFAVPSPGLALDASELDSKPNILAAYLVDERMICLRSNLIHPKLLAHEFGHYMYHYYNNFIYRSNDMSEAWAYYFEVMYEADGFNFNCSYCGATKPIVMLNTGDVQCSTCGSIFSLLYY